MVVDAVYTWVNSLDRGWRERYQRALAEEGLPGGGGDAGLSLSARFRDNGELRYSLRSIEQFAPFFRRVFLVVDGAPPPWLKPNVPDFRVVSHREIFPEGYPLPVFSSDQIEAYLWRIPDLSERYVYFNDDMMLVQPCTESDFFGPGGQSVVRMTPDLIYAPADPTDRIFNTMLRNTERAIRARLRLSYRPQFETKKPWVPLSLRRWLQSRLSVNGTAHIAQPFHRGLWPTFHRVFAGELKALQASKFRHARGFCVNLAYQYLAYREGYARFIFDPEDAMLSRRTAFGESAPSPKTVIRDLVAEGVRFVCFNDGLGPEGCDWEAFIDEALGPTLDVPSRWEIP